MQRMQIKGSAEFIERQQIDLNCWKRKFAANDVVERKGLGKHFKEVQEKLNFGFESYDCTTVSGFFS